MPTVVVFTLAILSTTSMPSVTLPNTQYPQPLPLGAWKFRKSLSTRLMKNWAVAVSYTHLTLPTIIRE